MTPVYQITHLRQDGSQSDITQQIKDRLISMTITDQSGIDSDQVVLVFDDTDGKLKTPNTNTNMKIAIGYAETGGPTTMGEFTISQIEYSGFPQRMTIVATSANMNGSLKSVKSHSFVDMTIRQIVEQIAKANNYEATVGKDIGDKYYRHIDQLKESDMNFLTRLAMDNDGVCKYMQNRILFIKNGTGKTASGNKLPVLSVDVNDKKLLDYNVMYDNRQVYNTVYAEYYDKGSVQMKRKFASTKKGGEPSYTIMLEYSDAKSAQEAADAQLNYFQRHTGTMTINMIGDSRFMSQFVMNVKGLKEDIDPSWVIQEVVHQFTPSSGFLTQVEAAVYHEPNPIS